MSRLVYSIGKTVPNKGISKRAITGSSKWGAYAYAFGRIQAESRILHIRMGGTIESVKGNNGRSVGKANVLTEDAIHGFCGNFGFGVDQAFVTDSQGNKIFRDSTEICPSDWSATVKRIYEILETTHRYRGVLITHGTDTMAYTASALSFMLGELSIPVVLTGSMREFDAEDSDARRNLNNAFNAIRWLRRGVYIVFGNRIILGCRASKTNNTTDNAFESVNYPPVGRIINDELKILDCFCSFCSGYRPNFRYIRNIPQLREPFDPGPFTDFAPIVQRISCEPGAELNISCLRKAPLTIEAFGDGNLPSKVRAKAKFLIKEGIPILITTSVKHGEVNLHNYATSLRSALSSHDMTREAAHAKFVWAIAYARGSIGRLKRLMEFNFADEINQYPDICQMHLRYERWKIEKRRDQE